MCRMKQGSTCRHWESICSYVASDLLISADGPFGMSGVLAVRLAFAGLQLLVPRNQRVWPQKARSSEHNSR